MKRSVAAYAVALGLALGLGACTDGGSGRSLSPIPPRTLALMSEKGMQKSDPILVRLYKKESELEVWKKVNGQYAHLKTFPICRWSGQLGPKVREGDRQAPEGFYNITPAQMNPNSSYYLSFDTGYPNSFDRANNRSGSYLMVHGTCSSRGCYAMTDEGIAEIYAIARESFAGGQKGFQFQAYPFKMTAENLARYRQDPNIAFWKNLKQGSDHFEITRREPKVSVCERRYAFDTVGEGCKEDPTLAQAVAQKDEEDRRQVAELVAKGTPAVRLVYADGGGHESFRTAAGLPPLDQGSTFAVLDSRPTRNIGDVSRPEALAEGPREVAIPEPAAKHGRPSNAIAALQTRPDPARTGSTTGTGGRTVVASADPDEPIPAPADKPFYERMIGGVFGRSADAAPAPAAAEPAPPAVEPKRKSAAVLPPSKPAESKPAKKAEPGAPPPKPQASLSVGAGESRLLSGAQAVGPSAGGFRVN